MAKVNVLGVLVDPTNLSEATARIFQWINEVKKTYVCVTGVHGIMESQRQPGLKAIHNSAGMVTPDGMPLVYISRAGGQPACGRVYGPEGEGRGPVRGQQRQARGDRLARGHCRDRGGHGRHERHHAEGA